MSWYTQLMQRALKAVGGLSGRAHKQHTQGLWSNSSTTKVHGRKRRRIDTYGITQTLCGDGLTNHKAAAPLCHQDRKWQQVILSMPYVPIKLYLQRLADR